MSTKQTITVETNVAVSPAQAWEVWTNPEHIIHWNFASPDWQCPAAENDLREGGKFSWRMEAKDGSMGFDYCGTYEQVVAPEKIVKRLDDGRMVEITFSAEGEGTKVVETFEIEDMNSADMQRAGWQAILENYKLRAEN